MPPRRVAAILGSPSWTRTNDTAVNSRVLYRLSYGGMCKTLIVHQSFVLALPIFPGRRQPSIVSRNELNCRVRNGNGWTLALISTNSMSSGLAGEQTVLYCISLPLSRTFALEKSGDPYRIRTDVNGVRGRCLNHLTNGPWCTFTDSNRGPTD